MIADPIDLDSLFERHYERARPYTLLMKAQVRSIFDRFVEVCDLPGDVIEFGTFQGGLSFFLGLCIKDLGLRKTVYALDSFEGLPETDPEHDGPFKRGTMASSLQAVAALCSRLGLDGVVEIRPGWFEHSVQNLPGPVRYCLAHLDADVYRSTQTAIQYVLPRLVDGGALVLDDFLFYGSTGVSQATDELLGTALHLHLGPKTQVFVYPKGDPRPHPPAPTWRVIGGRRYDLADLLARKDYLELLRWEAAFYDVRSRYYRDFLELMAGGAADPDSYWITSSIGLIRKQ